MCLWIYDFDLFRMRPAHLLVNSSPPCADWLSAESRTQMASESRFIFLSAFEVKGQACLVPGGVPRASQSFQDHQLRRRNRPSSVSKLLLSLFFSFFFLTSLESLLTLPLCYLLRHLGIWRDGSKSKAMKCFMHLGGPDSRFVFLSLRPRSEPAVKNLSAS